MSPRRIPCAVATVVVFVCVACSTTTDDAATGGSPSASPPGTSTAPAPSAPAATQSAGPAFAEPTAPGPPRTSCTRVAYIGESTSIGLVSRWYVSRKRDRLPAQFERVGVRRLHTDIAGARSVIERWHDEPN